MSSTDDELIARARDRSLDGEARFAAIEELKRRGLIGWENPQEALQEAEAAGYLRDLDEVMPMVLPASWEEDTREFRARNHLPPVARYFWADRHKLRVVAGVELHAGQKWLHVSCSRRDRLPTWDDLRHVKAVVMGPHRQAIQVLPKESEYVNLMKYALHMFSCLGVDPVPGFLIQKEMGMI